ncbi:MAG TPA: hypothetical protein VKB96_13150 [Gammaproteobacteria bacterium]|jgi:hypothetical protein|nr:hypothetical protein [Gammaproteobacteria bacterium]
MLYYPDARYLQRYAEQLNLLGDKPTSLDNALVIVGLLLSYVLCNP